MSKLSTRPSARRDIPVRRPTVDLEATELERWTVEGDPISSHILAVLSGIFPRGEEFFVATVREHRAAAAGDPVLEAQVKGFIGQEALHGREHRKINGRLTELGYDMAFAEAAIGRTLEVVQRFRPRTLPLATTAAAEHLTGILAEAVLTDEPTRRLLGPHPDLEALITWHALEELEHKNVAFDVLQRTGGGYVVRMAGAGVAGALLGGTAVLIFVRAVARDRRYLTASARRRFRRNLRRHKVFSPWALRQLLRYAQPGFHPDDSDTDHLVHEWRERLAGQVTEVAAGRRTA